MKKDSTITIQMLMLSDLLKRKAIDQSIYDLATKKLLSAGNDQPENGTTMILATA